MIKWLLLKYAKRRNYDAIEFFLDEVYDMTFKGLDDYLRTLNCIPRKDVVDMLEEYKKYKKNVITLGKQYKKLLWEFKSVRELETFFCDIVEQLLADYTAKNYKKKYKGKTNEIT